MTIFIKDLLVGNSRLKRIVQKVAEYIGKVEKQEKLSVFESELEKIDAEMALIEHPNLPQLFNNIPLNVFGKLLLDIPQQYQALKSFFPTMASEEIQKAWTGTHDEALLKQSLAFIKTMIFGYAAITGKRIEEAQVLDYGCGWGRLIRLLYKLVPLENIYGVDPWDESINICNQSGVKGNIAISDYVPLSLPFKCQFDLIFAFSVFTHLSEKTARIVLRTLRKYVSPNGVLVMTIRPKEYWNIHKKGARAPEMIKKHEERGFAFMPQDVDPIDGDITFGDTSMTLAYLASQFPEWKVESVEWNEVDPYQLILFLIPV